MATLYVCPETGTRLLGQYVYLLIEDWTLEGNTVTETAEGYAVTFPNGGTVHYNRA